MRRGAMCEEVPRPMCDELPRNTEHLEFHMGLPKVEEDSASMAAGPSMFARRTSQKSVSRMMPDPELMMTLIDADYRELRLSKLPKGEVFDWDSCLEIVDMVLATYRRQLRMGLKVLELGCGLGIVSFVCAALGAEVVCTDLEEALGPIRRNGALNGFPQLVWEVVGGERTGGINVQEEMGIGDLKERLKPGSLIEQMALEGNYIQYALLEGEGPKKGWVKLKRYGCDPDLVVSDERPLVNGNRGILRTVEFRWDTQSPEALLKWGGFDIIICSDCVYEPAYGAAGCIEALPKHLGYLCGENTTIFMGTTRRFADSVEQFWENIEAQPLLVQVMPKSNACGEKTSLYTLRKRSRHEHFYKDINRIAEEGAESDDEPAFFSRPRAKAIVVVATGGRQSVAAHKAESEANKLK